MGISRATKEAWFNKLNELLDTYPSIFIVNVDNVGSQQMHQIRASLRGKATVLMGKNTMVRRALRQILAEKPQFEKLMPFVKGNIGFVFTSGDLKDVRSSILSNRVAAPARAGAFAPADVMVKAGNTGMEPGKTSFFQALGVPTKIARGTIEIVSDVKVVTGGSRVGTSEATLLNMLNISPFTYGMTVTQIYENGQTFGSEVLDVSEDVLVDRFLSGIKQVASISLALNYPTIASVTHTLVNSYKNLLAVSLATDYEFEGSAKVSNRIRSSFCHRIAKYTLKIQTADKPKIDTHRAFAPLKRLMASLATNVCEQLTDMHSFRPRLTLPTPLPLQLLPLLLLLPRRPPPLPLRRRRRRKLRSPTMTWALVSLTKAYVLPMYSGLFPKNVYGCRVVIHAILFTSGSAHDPCLCFALLPFVPLLSSVLYVSII